MSTRRPLIVITGASRGIGAALTALYAADGHPIIAAARRFTGDAPANVTKVEADLAAPEGRRGLIDTVRADDRRVGLLINNAGIQNRLDLTADEAPEMVETEIALNLAAPIHLTRGLTLHMRHGSDVVNVTSLVALQPSPRRRSVLRSRRNCRRWPAPCATSWRRVLSR